MRTIIQIDERAASIVEKIKKLSGTKSDLPPAVKVQPMTSTNDGVEKFKAAEKGNVVPDKKSIEDAK